MFGSIAIDHSKTEFQNVRFSNVFGIRAFGIRAPTVLAKNTTLPDRIGLKQFIARSITKTASDDSLPTSLDIFRQTLSGN